MRSHPLIAIATVVILVGFGVKLAFFSAPKAAATWAAGSVGVSVAQTSNLPVQKIHDMTFVFSDGD